MSPSWIRLVNAFKKLPGVGPRMAERLALFVLRSSDGEELSRAIMEARSRLVRCESCGIFTEGAMCRRCQDDSRDPGVLCVIEEVGDLDAIERSGSFRGGYHILGGVLSPLDGVGPGQLRIDALVRRIKAGSSNGNTVKEIIVATNPTVEGEATASYLAQLLKPLSVRVTRLGYGMPSGASLEYADELTVTRALEGRQELVSE
jgi:recombination protein RecR